MDSYRATIPVRHEQADSNLQRNVGCLRDDEIDHEPPPLCVGQDERRMQVRAYNYWTSLLGSRSFPRIEDLTSAKIRDFAENAVVLDFSDGIENPAVTMLGGKLAEECGATKTIRRLHDVPGRSLLSRITEHYMQILTNEAPIGFEAEFVNLRGKTVVYRGILLPFASDGEKIRHIMGVINWKELADPTMTADLIRELDKAVGDAPVCPPLGEWADGPAMAAHDDPDDCPAIADLARWEPGDWLTAYLAELPGGLKGAVSQERELHSAETGKRDEGSSTSEQARRLRGLPTSGLDEIAVRGEFALLLVRRMPGGDVRLLGEINLPL